MRNLWEILEIPTSLKVFGLAENDIDMVTKDTIELGAALEQNPVDFAEKTSEIYWLK